MHKIMFRVWDRVHKKMYHNDYISDLATGEETVGTVYSDEFSKPFILFHGKNADFLQYTGVHDRYDTLIYEGDIVTFEYEIGEHEFETCTGEVFFEDGIFYFGRDEAFATNDVNFRPETLKVIGNIFENPEILKK